jgi:organic hydroperoxide reductase OsmC/OhrA
MDQQRLEQLAKSASDGCPFSQLIEASAQVTVNATLEGED